MPYTTIQAARSAHVSVQSIRNWTREYSDLLSPQGRGEAGTRQFSEQDLELLCTIADLRKSGVPPSEVRQRIVNPDVPPVIDASPQPTPQQTPQPTPNAQEAPEATFSLALVQSSLQAQREATETRVASLERQLRRQLWTHAVAFYLGVVTMGAIFYIVWWLVNGVGW